MKYYNFRPAKTGKFFASGSTPASQGAIANNPTNRAPVLFVLLIDFDVISGTSTESIDARPHLSADNSSFGQEHPYYVFAIPPLH